MPWVFRTHCPDCDHDWDATISDLSCGPIEDSEQDSWRRYWCPRCYVHLNVPAVLDRNSWLNSIAGRAREIAESHLLRMAHEQIARRFADARSRYAPIAIDVEDLSCTDCREEMIIGGFDCQLMFCPRCENRGASVVETTCHVSLFGDETPGPTEETIRELIASLHKLSEPSMRRRDLGTLPSEKTHPLWDREIDACQE